MALKIPWEQEEAVILLDALLKVRNGDITRKEAVANVSNELRQRAINKGIEIDEAFRNISGIYYQMSCLERVFVNYQSGLYQLPKLFGDVVSLYNNDRDVFGKILLKAKQNLNSDSNNEYETKVIKTSDSNKELSEENIKARRMAFINWLKKNDLPGFSTSNYVFALNAAFALEQCGALAMRLSLVDRNLFFIEDIDELRNIRTGLLLNQIKDKPSDKFISVLNKYIEFCNGGEPESFDKTNIAEQTDYIDGSLLEKNKKTIYDNNTQLASELQKPVIEQSQVEYEENIEQQNVNDVQVDNNVLATEELDYNVPEENDFGFEIILKEDFPNGFRMNSAIDKNRFRKFFSERFASELLESDEYIVEQLEKIGVQREGRIFIKNDSEQQKIIHCIIDDLAKAFDDGATCVYIEAIWKRYQNSLSDILCIYNIEALTDLLKKELQDKYSFFYNKYFCVYNRQADTYQDVLNCLKKYSVPVSYETLFDNLWYLPSDKIKQILASNKIFVCTSRGHYFYAPNLPVSDEELEQISDIICAELTSRSYISDVEMYSLLQEKCPMVLINTEEFSMTALRNVLGYLLSDTFSFNGKIITLRDKQISLSDVFAEFCHLHEKLTLSEIKDFAQELDTTINWNIWNTIRQNMVRISETEFVQFDNVNFDVSLIDEMLESICQHEYVPIQSVGLFMHFPAIGIQWNSYVLESYVYVLSKSFCLINAGFVEHGCYGAIVHKNSIFVDYQKLVVDALAHSQQWNTSKEALEFLIQEGYQSSRRFSNIDNVIKEAKLLREQLYKSKE